MKKLTTLISLVAVIGFYSCDDNSTQSTRLNVKLVDKPADYDEVNVEVIGVSINYGGENDEGGFQQLETQSGIYNLLTLTAGNEVLLDSNEIPSASISQIRLLLGEKNTVVEKGGESFPLVTPSGQSSGVKINLHQTFEGGIDYTIVLDFDAARSVVSNPQKYILKPVIKASMEALNGAIKGSVDPVDANVVIYALQGQGEEQDTITSTFPDGAGEFMLRGIPEGTYDISFDLDDEDTLLDQLIDGVNVSIGEVTDMGAVVLESKQE